LSETKWNTDSLWPSKETLINTECLVGLSKG
jgi:hypothetical protein